MTVTRDEKLVACGGCGAASIRQDEDVLDTWFSSALWPFSTLGWPDKNNLLEKFYPASDLETGYDILFFWVARMMMMGIHFMGKPPFKRVLLHGLVVDETGDKMSKVKGNVIDPLDLIYGAAFDDVVQKALPGAPIEEALKKFKKAYPSAAQMGSGFPAYGTDALRFTLASYSPQAKRIPLSPKKIEGYRHFCNKLWNATRFALPYLEGATVGSSPPAATQLGTRWILSRLASTIETVQRGIDDFRLDDSTQAAYRFFWNELCDWYLELSKPVFQGSNEAAKTEWRDVLAYVLEASLRLLHPFIPFITEELWHKVPRPDGSAVSLALAPYPTAATGRADLEAEREMEILMDVIGQARSMRTEHQIKPQLQIDLRLRSALPERRALLERERVAIEVLVKTSPGFPRILATAPQSETAGSADGSIVKGVDEDVRYQSRDYVRDVEVLLPIEELDKEIERLERTLKSDDKDVVALEKKLALPSFADKAPKEVVAQTHEELGLKKRRLASNRQSLELLKKAK